jgi:hypothetical protein
MAFPQVFSHFLGLRDDFLGLPWDFQKWLLLLLLYLM